MSTEISVIASVAEIAPRIDADNPWPGLLSFSEQDATFFKGRDHETDDLLRLVLRERLTVLFGVSGLGKSSLLQAGLFPRLRPENIFPIYIRFDFSAQQPDLVAQVFGAIAREAERITNGPDKRRVETPTARPGERLWEYFHRQGNSFWNERNRLLMPLLVFDQFEEVFTLGRQDADRAAASKVLLEQLADLVEGRPPAELKAWMDEHPDQASDFDFERDYYKVLLGIREDFLAALETLRPRMPHIAFNRLGLRRMNGEAALLVVNQAQHLIESDVAIQVVRFVGADQQSELKDVQIEPALLSVFCSELNLKRQEKGQAKITLELLQYSQQKVIANFYERSTGDLEPAVRTFIEDHLLTVSGYRDSVAVENALGMGISEATIKKLVDRRLLRQEDRGGPKRLELTHDLLAGVVRASRDTRHQREQAEKERAALIAEQERQREALIQAQQQEREKLEKAQEEEKRQRDQQELRRLRLRTYIATAAMLIAFFMAFLAFMAWRGARSDRDLAIQAQNKAQQAEKQALAAQADAEAKAAENKQYAEDLIDKASASLPQAAAGTQTSAVALPVPQRPAHSEAKAVSADGRRPASEMPPPPPPPQADTQAKETSTPSTNPPAAGPARVFIQIVNNDDRGYATQLGLCLKAFAVQGIQYVPQAAVLSRTDVRYYRESDKATADDLVNLLKAAGQPSARAYIPSGMANSAKVRPNTFEIWLANGSGSGAAPACAK